MQRHPYPVKHRGLLNIFCVGQVYKGFSSRVLDHEFFVRRKLKNHSFNHYLKYHTIPDVERKYLYEVNCSP
jgi:hypothetical protein